MIADSNVKRILLEHLDVYSHKFALRHVKIKSVVGTFVPTFTLNYL